MANEQDKEITSGTGGNTGGTGGPDYSNIASGGGAGAAGTDAFDDEALARNEEASHGGPSEQSRARQQAGGATRSGGGDRPDGPGSDELAHASHAVREAIEGGANAGGEGPGAVSGKLSSEGTGPAGAGIGPSAGDVGGMGGARAAPPNHDNRPPGGVSPLSNPREQD